MIDIIILSAALFFGILTVYSRDNVYSATSLAASAGAVGAYYAYLAQFAPAFLIFVIYIGAVMLLVIVTAAMYGGTQRWAGRYLLVATLFTLAAAALGVLAIAAPQRAPSPAQPPDLLNAVVMLIGVAVASLVVAIETGRRT
ncbi:NADH-ubiquinone oxidoreductase [Pyrobaculum ferrireducens]|uniref:NADH-ubiquinone oxidoreductase subunit n=1 Tax=Pyrobaculum ferrireducens TaxID=1104324 RepID=G7VFN3_9CREN|nr:NADH-ubiquinone oxidoreductase [Pyrobaculum ferrireducens]AET34239.1 NADH-ubiquinone oxidoreductase subunit [Pyrobaculum ferrireducens]